MSDCTHDVMVTTKEMDTANRVQILDESVSISHSASILKKGMDPTILPPVKGKIVGQTKLFSLGMATGLGERKLSSNLLNSIMNWIKN